ncbi:glutamate/aspartate transport system permease [Acinetobacter rudis CIP 110305]|uniref:Glutamate/aspartate transport system permease n=1 Tax=Acinetobacter rudis CIP 110305 TaxID=421052 RepID=S3MSG3_9GAMM|nr:glutamate/aspartate transport system permease [Acinetobacter rudis CIP 110305]
MDFSLLTHPDVSTALLSGFKFTMSVTLLSIFGGILLGTPLAMMRLSNNKFASQFAKFYVDFFRGVPLIQVIFIFYFLLPKFFEFQSDTYYGPLFSSVVTFAIFEAAFFSEICALRHSIHLKRSKQCRLCFRSNLWANHVQYCTPSSISQYATYFTDTIYCFIPRYFIGLCY